MPDRTPYEKALLEEAAVMRRVVAALERVDRPARERILRYLVDLYPAAASTTKETPS